MNPRSPDTPLALETNQNDPAYAYVAFYIFIINFSKYVFKECTNRKDENIHIYKD